MASYPRIDFGYAFSAPHRLTVCRPEASEKTLLDCYPDRLRLAWSYEDLRRLPLLTNSIPRTAWEVSVTCNLGGEDPVRTRWERREGWIPALVYDFEARQGVARLEVMGAEGAALARVTVTNKADLAWDAEIRCALPGPWAVGYNPAWVRHGDPGDTLLAGWTEAADRVLLLGLGADSYPVARAEVLTLAWRIPPRGERKGWIVRPYHAAAADLPALRARRWLPVWAAAETEWRTRVRGADRLSLPDPDVALALRSCLADLYVMREPIADGSIAGTAGTELYRAANSIEPAVVSIALDQLGDHREAADGLQASLAAQGPDGDWCDPTGWGHLMWGTSGFKAWAVLEHWRHTRDREYLERQFPRLLACSRFQERLRSTTRGGPGARPGTAGLMPRGVGDAGLMDGDDHYGIFLPHNIWAVFADLLALEAARALGRPEAVELEAIHARADADLRRALDEGAIPEPEGYRWIPGAPGTRSGSRWGSLNALYPCRTLAPDHPLIAGTLRRMETDLSPGGIPLGTGWLREGMWVAITLDNLAQAHLALGNGERAAGYLYAVLNHGTPLWTWCEERGPEPGSERVTGDRQHLWTPVAVVRLIRDMLIQEEGDGLHLARGVHPGWLDSGRPLGSTGAPTWFGRLTCRLQLGETRDVVETEVTLEPGADRKRPAWVRLHHCLPAPTVIERAIGDGVADPVVAKDRRSVLIASPPDTFRIRASLR